jgi:hypothetical protein
MGLSMTAYEAMLEKQGNCCAICGTDSPGGKGRWHVDHDHACCGRKRACEKCIRGLLCAACNIGIGYMKDDPALLRKAADYLETAAASPQLRSVSL